MSEDNFLGLIPDSLSSGSPSSKSSDFIDNGTLRLWYFSSYLSLQVNIDLFDVYNTLLDHSKRRKDKSISDSKIS